MTDEEDVLSCPRDGTELVPRTYEDGIEVDSCDTCRGMWLDAGELKKIEETSERDYSEDLARAGDDATAEIDVARQLAEAPIACLVCGATMETREYAYCSQVVIDTCPQGCGVWLDAGEIQALERFFGETQKRAKDAIPLRWRLWASVRSVFRKEE